jgi:hypothetical protein
VYGDESMWHCSHAAFWGMTVSDRERVHVSGFCKRKRGGGTVWGRVHVPVLRGSGSVHGNL